MRRGPVGRPLLAHFDDLSIVELGLILGALEAGERLRGLRAAAQLDSFCVIQIRLLPRLPVAGERLSIAGILTEAKGALLPQVRLLCRLLVAGETRAWTGGAQEQEQLDRWHAPVGCKRRSA
jgi:hypothetical protein